MSNIHLRQNIEHQLDLACQHLTIAERWASELEDTDLEDRIVHAHVLVQDRKDTRG